MLNMHNFTLPLDRDSEEPIYRQLIRHIRAQIDGGVLAAGTRLPASRDLARQLNISRISVVNAYAELRAENYLSAHAGRGTFVAGDRDPVTVSNGNGSAPPTPHHPIEIPTAPDRSLRASRASSTSAMARRRWNLCRSARCATPSTRYWIAMVLRR